MIAETAEGARQRKRLYLDTSAYLCILLREEGHDSLSRETANAELLSSVLLVLESRRNLVRLTREGILQAEQYKTCLDRLIEDTNLFVLCDLTLELCQSSTLPPISTPRSPDLAHLRTALWFNSFEKIDRFVTQDESQRQAAKELGLPV